jgi:O-antigen/teichoic acid export membrane protein
MRRSINLVLLASLPVAVGVATLVRPALGVALPEYLGSAPLIAVLAIAIVPRSLGALCAGGFLTPSGRARTVARITAGAAIANVGLDFLLIPWFGAMGSVVGSVCVQSAAGVVGLSIAGRGLGLQPGALLPPLLRSVVVAVCIVGVIMLCLRLPMTSEPIRVALAASAALAVFISAMALFWKHMKPEEAGGER